MKSFGIYNRIFIVNHIILTFLLFILTAFTNTIAQENFPIGGRPAALANAVVMESDIWSVSHNQAGLDEYHQLSIGFYHENKFIVDEYAIDALAVTLPAKSGTFGLSYTYFGYPKYNESKMGLAFGKRFGDKFSAGIQMNYHFVYIDGEYENRHALTVEGGIQYKPIDAIRIGVHVFNPTRSHFQPVNVDTLVTTIRTGISYSPVEKLWMAVEMEKSIYYNLRVKSGIEYEILKGFFLRTGIITQPFKNTFGLGFNIKRVSADVAFSQTETLGLSPHFSMQVRLK